MKIVSTTGGFGLESLGGAIQLAGFDFTLWNFQITPLLDMFYDIKPDILFYHVDDPALAIARKKYPKTIFYDIRNSDNMPKLTGKYCNIAQFLGGIKDKKYECDLGLFTYGLPGQITEKDLKIDEQNFNIIRAWGTPINSAYYVGNLKTEEKKHAVASTACWLSITPEDYWNACLNKSMPITEIPNRPGIDPTNFLSRRELIEKNYRRALNQTSFHFAADFLKQLNFISESEQCLIALNKLYEKKQIQI